MKDNNFYTQIQRFAVGVLFIVGLVSGSKNALSAPKGSKVAETNTQSQEKIQIAPEVHQRKLNSRGLQSVIKAIDELDPNGRDTLIKVLYQLFKNFQNDEELGLCQEVVKVLVVLGSNDENALAFWCNEACKQALLQVLSTASESDVLMAVVGVIGRFEKIDEACKQALLQVLSTASDSNVRMAVVDVIGRFENDEDFEQALLQVVVNSEENCVASVK